MLIGIKVKIVLRLFGLGIIIKWDMKKILLLVKSYLSCM